MRRGGSIRNIIGGVVNDLGTGKTLLLTLIGYLCHIKGYVIIANYQLTYPHIRIESVKNIESVTEDKSKSYLFLFDEPFISADSRLSHSKLNIEISRKILQSRKLRMHILYTARYIKEIEIRMRIVTNWIFKPYIIATDKENKPLFLLVEKYKRDMVGDMTKRGNPEIISVIVDGINACDMYKTEEIVTQFKQEESLKSIIDKEKLKEYQKILSKFNLTKGELKAKIFIDNPSVSKTDISELVNYMFVEEKLKND